MSLGAKRPQKKGIFNMLDGESYIFKLSDSVKEQLADGKQGEYVRKIIEKCEAIVTNEPSKVIKEYEDISHIEINWLIQFKFYFKMMKDYKEAWFSTEDLRQLAQKDFVRYHLVKDMIEECLCT